MLNIRNYGAEARLVDIVAPERSWSSAIKESIRADGKLRYLFLRQFRDPTATARASYQAVVEGTVTPAPGSPIVELHDVDASRFSLEFGSSTIADWIRDTLGLTKVIEPIAAFKASKADLDVNRGEVKWDRP